MVRGRGRYVGRGWGRGLGLGFGLGNPRWHNVPWHDVVDSPYRLMKLVLFFWYPDSVSPRHRATGVRVRG